MKLLKVEKYLVVLIISSFLVCVLFGIIIVSEVNFAKLQKTISIEDDKKMVSQYAGSEYFLSVSIHDTDDVTLSTSDSLNSVEENYPPPNYDIHAFYYPWYGTPQVDGKYLHWNHRLIPHWDKKTAALWPSGRHQPPEDIGSNYYPLLGPYSSKNTTVLEEHMRQVRSAGIGVLVVSWYPPGQADDEGENVDSTIEQILQYAHKYSVKVCFHIEPYKNRNVSNLRDNLRYITSTYGSFEAVYRRQHGNQSVPVYYIYDSYLTSVAEWQGLLLPGVAGSVRGGPLDAVFIGLLVQRSHLQDLFAAGFDGAYTYFATDGFTYGSTAAQWRGLAQQARQAGRLFVPSVGPGYVDTRVRPWNDANTRNRDSGSYYEQHWQTVIQARPDIVSITSFNEWGEGTQIEPAIPHSYPGFVYLNYLPHKPDYYLTLTRNWILQFMAIKG